MGNYLFGTAYVPREQPDLPLGVAQYPTTFAAQQLEPFVEFSHAWKTAATVGNVPAPVVLQDRAPLQALPYPVKGYFCLASIYSSFIHAHISRR